MENLDTKLLLELVRQRMCTYLLEIRKQVKDRKCYKSNWFKKTLFFALLGFGFYKIESYGIQNLINKGKEESVQIIGALQRFFHSHLEEPLTRIYRTIRYDEATLGINVSTSNLDAERNALATMVIDYLKENHPNTIANSNDYHDIYKQASEGNLAMVIDDYASSVKTPIHQSLFGPLLQLVLIQVHKLKVDAERSIVVMDQLMRANELNFQLLTLFPAVLLLGGSFYWIYRKFYGGVDPRVVAHIRHQFRQVSIVINSYNSNASTDISTKKHMSTKDMGKLVFCINSVQENADKLSAIERKYLLKDSQELLDSTFTISQKLVTVDRIYHNLNNHV